MKEQAAPIGILPMEWLALLLVQIEICPAAPTQRLHVLNPVPAPACAAIGINDVEIRLNRILLPV